MPTTVAWCVEVSASEHKPLGAAFGAHTGLEARLLSGCLGDHLDELAGAEVLSIFIASRLDAGALARLPRLRLVATRSTGIDHIDLDVCRRRDIAVANVPSYGENTVAEHTWALLLALSRRLLAADREGRRGHLDRANLQGVDLKGRTIGVVGSGRIGLHVIRIARAFEMRVLACDPPRPRCSPTCSASATRRSTSCWPAATSSRSTPPPRRTRTTSSTPGRCPG